MLVCCPLIVYDYDSRFFVVVAGDVAHYLFNDLVCLLVDDRCQLSLLLGCVAFGLVLKT